jgi:alanine dehydrogenase
MISNTLLLNKSDIGKVITLNEAIEVIEEVFLAYANGKIQLCPLIHADVDMGEFHIKAGGYKEGLSNYFTTKINGGFFSNTCKHKLPNILGLIVLNSIENGFPLAILESSTITAIRTAAATGVAIKYLANPKSTIATICGCGNQAYWQLQALKEIIPSTEKVFVFSQDLEKSHLFAKKMSEKLRIELLPTDNLQSALKISQICITCTSSKKYIIEKDMLPDDIFIAAVGADSPDKQEIDPFIFENAKIVADVKTQSATVGDAHHALKLNIINQDKIIELGEVISSGICQEAGHKGVTIFDSTGTAMQDTALASIAYRKALEGSIGTSFDFFSGAQRVH